MVLRKFGPCYTIFLPQKQKNFLGPWAPLTFNNSETFFAKKGMKKFRGLWHLFPLPFVVEVFGQKGQKNFGAFGLTANAGVPSAVINRTESEKTPGFSSG